MSKEKRKQRGKELDKVVFPMAENLSEMPQNYKQFIEELKTKIQQERLKTVWQANRSMMLLYWNIGKSILEHQQKEG